MEVTKKVFNIYYNMCCQRIVVYSGVPQSEIFNTIYELLSIPKESKINILDEDGIPVVLSSYLPSYINLYVQIQKTFTDKLFEGLQLQTNVTQAITLQVKSAEEKYDWIWNEPSASSHKLKNNNKTVYQPQNETMSSCKGSLIMTTGEFFYSLLIEPLQCCVYASVYPINDEVEYENFEFCDFWNLWTDYPDPHSTFPGPVIEAGFYVNMNQNLVIICDNKKNKELKRFNIKSTWKSVSPVVYFKHVVSVTIISEAVRTKPDWIIV